MKHRSPIGTEVMKDSALSTLKDPGILIGGLLSTTSQGVRKRRSSIHLMPRYWVSEASRLIVLGE